jgi:hypothetical protein
VGLANLGSKSETCVGSRVHLVGASISFKKNIYRLPFTPPLSGSPYWSFVTDCPEKVKNKDSYKHKSKTDGKYRSRRDHKSKHNSNHKDERRSRKKESRGKARAMVGASDVDSSSAYSTSSSSSSEYEGDHRKGRKSSKNLSGLLLR